MAKAPPKINRAHLPEHFFRRFIPDTRPVRTRACDHPGCEGVGEYRAPARHYREEVKVGALNIIDEKREQPNRWFCLDHVKQYNASWDYYEGLNQGEMEEAIRQDAVWNRPTWPIGQWGPKSGGRREEQDGPRHRPQADEAHEEVSEPSAALMMEAGRSALAEMGLEPPVDFIVIKKRYRELVKRHHPDMKMAEAEAQQHEDNDTIQRLNAAFTFLKSLYARQKV